MSLQGISGINGFPLPAITFTARPAKGDERAQARTPFIPFAKLFFGSDPLTILK